MPQVLNIRDLPGFSERQPIIPPGAVYIGRANRWYRQPKSEWANPFHPGPQGDPTEHEVAVASYERWLRSQPRLMDALPELRGLDLVCWCAPLPCHDEVLLRLAKSSAMRTDLRRPARSCQS